MTNQRHGVHAEAHRGGLRKPRRLRKRSNLSCERLESRVLLAGAPGDYFQSFNNTAEVSLQSLQEVESGSPAEVAGVVPSAKVEHLIPEERVVSSVGALIVESNTIDLVRDAPVTSIVVSGSDETVDMAALSEEVLSTVYTIDIRGTGDNTARLLASEIADFTPNQTLLVIADPGDEVVFDAGWIFVGTEVVDDQLHRLFTNGTANTRLIGPRDWQNPRLATDVNGNGTGTASDALAVINALTFTDLVTSQRELVDAATVQPGRFKFYDVNGDGKLSALDALFVINRIDVESNLNAEAVPNSVDAEDDATFVVDLTRASTLSSQETTSRATQGAPSRPTGSNRSHQSTTALSTDDRATSLLDESLASTWDWIDSSVPARR